MRWFRLAGLPAAERLAALRLQVDAWQPFRNMGGRLVLSGDDGLAVVWDAAAVQQRLLAEGLAPERCQLFPETLSQAAGADGLRLLRCAEGFEAQCWREGFLSASRWWAEPLQPQDWQEFVRASGAARDGETLVDVVPEPQTADTVATVAWAKHYPLHATADDATGMERRTVVVGGLVLTLVAGGLGHQLWSAHQHSQQLTRQISETKAAASAVLRVRDATMATVGEVEKLASWFAAPQPIEVIAYLNDALGRSGVQIKDFDLEADKLRLGLQLTPQATRAGVVRELQAGGWFTDVTEVRADNGRGLLTMEMRINGARRPAVAAQMPVPGTEAAPAIPAGAAPVSAPPTQSQATAQPRAGAAGPAVPAPVATAPAPVKASSGPLQPIIAKPDANGMPPPDVFNAIPNR